MAEKRTKSDKAQRQADQLEKKARQASLRQSGLDSRVTRDRNPLGRPVAEAVLHLAVGQRSSITFIISSAHRTASADCAHRRRDSFPAIELGELRRRQDTCRYQQHAFAALVHVRSLSCSLFVRLGLK